MLLTSQEGQKWKTTESFKPQKGCVHTENKPGRFPASKISANILSHYAECHNLTHYHLHTNRLCLTGMFSFHTKIRSKKSHKQRLTSRNSYYLLTTNGLESYTILFLSLILGNANYIPFARQSATKPEDFLFGFCY